MTLAFLLFASAFVLLGLLVLTLLVYLLVRPIETRRRAYLDRKPRTRPSAQHRLHKTRRLAQQAIDDASDEFLDDIYEQVLRDWSRF